MTDYPYDPELPYAVARIKEGEEAYPVGIIARFKDKHYAQDMVNEFTPGWVELVDTTPKPKIPADAEFIFWCDGEERPYYARRWSNPADKVWETDDGFRVREESLLGEGWIGDAEVVVLKRA